MTDPHTKTFDLALALEAAADRAEANEKNPSVMRRLDKFVSEALAIEEQDAKAAGALGYMARLLVQVTMPHSKTTETFYQRRNGTVSISMLARPDIGLPYGHYPRLLMAWVTTEAVKTRSQDLVLGESLSAFMTQLGLTPTGGRWGSVARLRDHMKRLFSATVSWTYEGANQGWLNVNVNPVEASSLWWDPKHPDQVALWKSTISLNRRFYEEIINRPVPIDMRALKALARERSPLALDIYTWLTYRVSYLQKEVTIPWQLIEMQFGGEYARTRDFKAKFIERLRFVLTLYHARVTPHEEGLVLQPSSTHINKMIS